VQACQKATVSSSVLGESVRSSSVDLRLYANVFVFGHHHQQQQQPVGPSERSLKNLWTDADEELLCHPE